MFQGAKVSMHCLHVSFVTIYKEFLSCYNYEEVFIGDLLHLRTLIHPHR